MSTTNKLLQSNMRIRFQDCDPYQHLNNAIYLHYFINAREDQVLEHYGLDVYKLAKEKGLGWVVGQNQIAYFKPAQIMEEIIIESQLIQYSERTLTVEMRMYNSSKTELKSFIWTTFVHFNLKSQRSQIHDEKFSSLFKSVLLPVPENIFEDRVQILRKKIISV